MSVSSLPCTMPYGMHSWRDWFLEKTHDVKKGKELKAKGRLEVSADSQACVLRNVFVDESSVFIEE